MSNHAKFDYAGRPFGAPAPVLKRLVQRAASLFKPATAAAAVLAGQDSVGVTAMSGGLSVYCGYEAGTPGYANGGYTTMPQVYADFPGKRYVSVGRDAIDIEPGLASASDAPGFVRGWKKVNTNKPVCYADASDMPGVIAALNNAGIPRSDYYLWVAEWDGSSAIPSGYDAKQYASNNSYDSDSFYDYMFGAVIPPAPVFPMKQGNTGQQVVTLQTNLNKWHGYFPGWPKGGIAQDGNFGAATTAAVVLAQKYFNDKGASGTVSQALYNELAGPFPKPPPPVPTWTFQTVRSLKLAGTATTGSGSTAVSFADIVYFSPDGFIGTPVGKPGVNHYQIAVSKGTKLTTDIAMYPAYDPKAAIPEQQFRLLYLAPSTQYTIGVRAELATSADAPNAHAGPWVTLTFTTPAPVNPNFPLKQGSTDTADVKTLQTRLNAWGFGSLTVDGIFGPLTAAAVTAAQTSLQHTEPAAGECDQTLFTALAANPPKGKYPGASQAVSAAFAQINGEIIYGYLREHGYNEIQAAGATASMWGEGEWSPEVAGSGGWGLMGWTGNYPDSRTGNPAADMAQQLGLILQFVAQFGDQGVVNQMASAATVLDSANLWGVGVERFGINDVHAEGIAAVQAIALKLDGVNLP